MTLTKTSMSGNYEGINLFDFQKPENSFGSVMNPLGSYLSRPKNVVSSSTVPPPSGGGTMSPTVGYPSSLPSSLPKGVSINPNRKKNAPKQVASTGDDLSVLTDEDITKLMEAGATDDEITQVAKSIKEESDKKKTDFVEAPKDERSFLSKFGESLISAPSDVIKGGAGLLENAITSAIPDKYLRKPGEVGTLGETVEPQKSNLTNALTLSRGATGTAFATVAPYVYGGLSAVGSTETGGEALGTVGDFLHSVGKGVYSEVPGLKDLKEEDANLLTDTILNAWAVKSGASKTISGKTTVGKKAGVVNKLNTHPGMTLKELGSGIINQFYKSAETEGAKNAAQNYRAGITGEKPVTIGDVAGEYGLSGSRKQMGADARVAAKNLWEKDVNPAIEASTSKISASDMLEGVKRDMMKNVSEAERGAFENAFKEIEESYKGKEFDAKSLAKEKSQLQEKTVNVSETSGAKAKILEAIAKASRKNLIDIVKNDTGIDLTNAFLKYGELKALVDEGMRAEGITNMPNARGGAGAGGLYFHLLEGLSGIATPIGTTLGGIIYKLGNGLELVGPKGLKTISDFISNSGKVKVRNPEVITEKAKQLPSGENTVQSANVINVKPETGYSPGVIRKTSEAISSKVGETPKSGKYVPETPSNAPLLTAPKTPGGTVIPRTPSEQMGQFELRNAIIRNPQKASSEAFTKGLEKGKEVKKTPVIRKKNVPKPKFKT